MGSDDNLWSFNAFDSNNSNKANAVSASISGSGTNSGYLNGRNIPLPLDKGIHRCGADNIRNGNVVKDVVYKLNVIDKHIPII